jgi:predicted esterase
MWLAMFAVGLVISGCRSIESASFARNSLQHDTNPQASSNARASSYKEAEPQYNGEDHDNQSQSDNDEEAPSRWPTRWGNDPSNPGTIIDLDPTEALRPIHLSRYHQYRSTDTEYNDANTLAADVGIETGFRFKSEGPGSFLFVPNPRELPTKDINQDSGKMSPSEIPDLAFKFVSASIKESSDIEILTIKTMELETSKKVGIVEYPTSIQNQERLNLTEDEDHVILQRTWFTYRDPKQPKQTETSKPSPSVEPIGTIILLPGMFGTPDIVIDGIERFWHAKGYAILRMRSQPSRFTEHRLFRINQDMGPIYGETVAQLNDNRVAEGAYATKAALEHVYAKRPELIEKPAILVGMSGGAMMLPTVYAYSPDDYDAAVLIAGGADFLRITIESNYKEWIDALVFDFDPDPKSLGKIDEENLAKFSKNYLKHSKLDAYHTALDMRDVPILMLHGSRDRAVPAKTGDLLYNQLNQPERWTYPIGHELIFAGLPTQVSRIDRWINKNVYEDQAKTADTPSQP